MSQTNIYVQTTSLVGRVLRSISGHPVCRVNSLNSKTHSGLNDCKSWLARNGVPVLMVVSSGEGDSIIVNDCPGIYRAFREDERAWLSRRREGQFNVYKWFGIRFGVTVLWEQYECV